MENVSTINTFNPQNVYLTYQSPNTNEQYDQPVDTLVESGTLSTDDEQDMDIVSVTVPNTPFTTVNPKNVYLIYENNSSQCVADVVQNGTLCDESDDLNIISVEIVSEFN